MKWAFVVRVVRVHYICLFSLSSDSGRGAVQVKDEESEALMMSCVCAVGMTKCHDLCHRLVNLSFHTRVYELTEYLHLLSIAFVRTG